MEVQLLDLPSELFIGVLQYLSRDDIDILRVTNKVIRRFIWGISEYRKLLMQDMLVAMRKALGLFVKAKYSDFYQIRMFDLSDVEKPKLCAGNKETRYIKSFTLESSADIKITMWVNIGAYKVHRRSALLKANRMYQWEICTVPLNGWRDVKLWVKFEGIERQQEPDLKCFVIYAKYRQLPPRLSSLYSRRPCISFSHDRLLHIVFTQGLHGADWCRIENCHYCLANFTDGRLCIESL